jgi:hypothetical protein
MEGGLVEELIFVTKFSKNPRRPRIPLAERSQENPAIVWNCYETTII